MHQQGPGHRHADLQGSALRIRERADCAAPAATAASAVLVRLIERRGLDLAGEEGLHFVTLGGNQFAKTNLDTFKAAFTKRGGKAAQPKPEFSGGVALGVQRHIFVDETDEKAYAWAKPAMENHLGNINWIRNKHGVTMTAERMRNVRGQNFEEGVAEGSVIAGSPKTVLEDDPEAAQGNRLQLSPDLSLPRHHVGGVRDALAQAVHRRGDAHGRADVIMSAKRERIQPDKLHVRKDGDKVLYSQVMVVEVGGARQIFVAGQTPRDRHGNCVGPGDMRAQIEQVGENIKAALEAAGATLADIVKTTTYVTDMDEYFEHQDMRMRYFAAALPTSTTVQVARLSRPEFMVEIEAFAIV